MPKPISSAPQQQVLPNHGQFVAHDRMVGEVRRPAQPYGAQKARQNEGPRQGCVQQKT